MGNFSHSRSNSDFEPTPSRQVSRSQPRLLIAASGTGGHVFPAIATAAELSDFEIEWLGVPDRLETKLVGDRYPFHSIAVTGFQQKLGLGTLKILGRLIQSIWQVRTLLKQGNFAGVFTTGGYISGPAILAARWLGLPVILHESNALPGKVTRWFAPWCTATAIGFTVAAQRLPKGKTIYVGTPLRSQFHQALATPDLPHLSIPADVPLIVVVGGSQGAVGMNKLVRQAAPRWLAAGAWVVHLTGDQDPEAASLQHPQYMALPFYEQMAVLLQRANLVISRSGAGTLTELAMTHTPAILIPFPYAAENHQTFNAEVFAQAGAAKLFHQRDLSPDILESEVLDLIQSPQQLASMAERMGALAVVDSAERTAQLVRECVAQRR